MILLDVEFGYYLLYNYSIYRAVGRSKNPGVPVLFGGHNLPPPLVKIGLTDLPKSGGARAPPGPPACDGPATVQQKCGVL